MNVQNNAGCERAYNSICTREWWESVISQWNISNYKIYLSNFKRASFIVHNIGYNKIIIEWDAQGEAKLIESDQEETPTFSASLNCWYAFINGEFGAAEGVMKGRIKFQGSLIAILPYIEGFNFLAKVARSVTDPN